MSGVYDGTVDREVIQEIVVVDVFRTAFVQSHQNHVFVNCLRPVFQMCDCCLSGFSLLHICNFSYVRVIADCVGAVKSGASDVYFNISSVITVTLRCKWSCAGSRDLLSHIYCSYIDLGNMVFILQWRVFISQWYVSIGNNIFREVRITRRD